MDERALFTKFWENESKTTRKVIARIPEGSDYRPDPKSRTAREIAWHIKGNVRFLGWVKPPRRQYDRDD